MADRYDYDSGDERAPLTGHQHAEDEHEEHLPVSRYNLAISGFFFGAASIILGIFVFPSVRMNPRFAFAGKES